MKVELQNLTKIFPSRNKKENSEVIAVNNFTFEIPDGKLVGLLGPSGCGKSTTLYMISGLQKPTGGKIFFGDGTPESIIGLIGTKHKGETFLIATAESSGKDAVTKIFETQKFAFETAVFVKPVSQDIKDVDLHSYDLAVLFNPADVKSLYENHPDFVQGDLKFVSYGKSIVKAMEEAGLAIEISAPTVEAPSVAKALELYLSKN